MNSPIKLPPRPPMDVGMSGQVKFAYSQEALDAYAEQAVREALAAQEVKAWLIRERKNGTDPMFTIAMTTEPFTSIYWPLAIIPENNHGDTP